MTPREKLHIAIEDSYIKALKEDGSRSLPRMKKLYSSIRDYCSTKKSTLDWQLRKPVNSEAGTFKFDLYAKDDAAHRIILVKSMGTSINKNVRNYLIGSWGEAVRTRVVQQSKTSKVLWIYVYPIKGLVVHKKRGEIEWEEVHIDEKKIFELGVNYIDKLNTKFEYTSLKHRMEDYPPDASLTSKDDLAAYIKKREKGKRLIIDDIEWRNFESQIDWLLE